MKRLPDNPVPIEYFPLPWSEALPGLVGNYLFQVAGPMRKPIPHEWLGLVSSHNTKHGYANHDWQESLKSALQLAQRQGWGILCTSDAPYSEIIVHACKRFDVPFRKISCFEPANTKLRSKDQEYEQEHSCDLGVLWLDPVSGHCGRSGGETPVHDSALIFLANHLFVIDVREKGKVAALLTSRLSCPDIPIGSTYLSLPNGYALKAHSQKFTDWLALGAIGWLNTTTNSSIRSGHATPKIAKPNSIQWIDTDKSTVQPVFPMRLLGTTKRKYLIHCTRSRRGPWPDQSVSQFHDELLQNPWSQPPSVLATLQRILQQQRLIATNNFRRGNTPTVCFSGNEIHELLSMRRFQSHIARWDWEPYGIMIDWDWLLQNGARQVSYIDPVVAKKTSMDELPYCQVVASSQGATNWRQEQEWRVAGDIRLSKVPFSKAIVFVPNRHDASVLRTLSRWPIAIVNADT